MEEELSIVRDCGAWLTIVERLQAVHPSSRPHNRKHDRGMWDLLTEVQAFAWVRTEHRECPEFVTGTGLPDIRWGEGHWLEAKAVHRSADEEERIEAFVRSGRDMVIRTADLTPTPDGLMRKLESAYVEAAQQLRRVESRSATVWIQLRGVDFGVSHEAVRSDIASWSARKVHPGAPRIVVVWGRDWRTPFVDTGLPEAH
jgi:hypothetical protein